MGEWWKWLIFFRNTLMQMVTLDLTHPYFYCPATGQLITIDSVIEASPATVFIYLDDEDEFQIITPELEKIFKAIEKEAAQDESADHPFHTFLETVDNDSIVCFQVTIGGLEYGPISWTSWIGINMKYQPENQKYLRFKL
jgi:hypothetical protein